MKLFRKTLLFFIGAILFQSALTILLVTNATQRVNRSDAQKELETEAAILYDGLNSWKRQIWMSLIELSKDPQLSRLDPQELAGRLREGRLAAKMDALVLKSAGGPVTLVDQGSPASMLLRDLEGLSNLKSDPYIELVELQGTLCLIGTNRLSLLGGGRYELFLIKRVDSEFCSQLTLNRRSMVAFLLGTRVLAASFPSELSYSSFDPSALQSAYAERYDQRIGGARYSVAVQRLGRPDQAQEGDELFQLTLLSMAPYDERVLVASRAVLLVSVAGALLTLVLSLFFSRNITHPIAALTAGMQRLREGAWDTRVRMRGGLEIGRLSQGFNELAGELAASRSAMREALRRTQLLKEYNEQIIDSIRAGIAIVNRELVVEKINRSFLESFGLSEPSVVGAGLASLGLDIVDDALVERIRSIFRRERQFHSEVKRSAADRVYEVRLYPFYSPQGELEEASGCVLMCDDISAKTRLEQRIFQAEKLSTISMLSAGMAHEINNPLGSILTNVQNLIEEEHSAERRISLRWIEQETRRIARIVQELLNFASTDSGSAPGSDVNAVAREVVAMACQSLAREGIVRIDTRLSAPLPLSAVSRDELKQVVINLLKNALQAIQGPGRILVTTRMAGGGQRILLAVSDTGRGIPKEIVPRIFDPFFTTKANGEGTGLGLSVVYGIVTKYSGTIDVRSRPGEGTRMALLLPLAGGHGLGEPGGRVV